MRSFKVICGPLLYFYEGLLYFYEVLLKFNGFKFTRELFRYMKDTLVRILCNKSVTLLSKCLYLPNGGNLKTSKTGHSRNPLPYSDSQSQHDPSTVAPPILRDTITESVALTTGWRLPWACLWRIWKWSCWVAFTSIEITIINLFKIGLDKIILV